MKPSKIPAAPRGLRARARRLWVEVHEAYELDVADVEILRLAVEALDRYDRALGTLRKDGEVILDRFKQKRLHPAHRVARDSRLDAMKALYRLGLDADEVAAGIGTSFAPVALPARATRRA